VPYFLSPGFPDESCSENLWQMGMKLKFADAFRFGRQMPVMKALTVGAFLLNQEFFLRPSMLVLLFSFLAFPPVSVSLISKLGCKATHFRLKTAIFKRHPLRFFQGLPKVWWKCYFCALASS